MIRLLQLLFLGHVHKWKIISQYDVVRDETTTRGKPEDIVATAYTCQCEECGVLRFRKDWVFANN